MSHKKTLLTMYRLMEKHYGYQDWWPGDTPFEIMVGAILTQNTAWTNVEKAIGNLKKAKALTPKKLFSLSRRALADLIQPAGFFNVKEKRLRNFLNFLKEKYQFSLTKMRKRPLGILRKELLRINGIGAETADSILLYACQKPTFVVDAYTKRILKRHQLLRGDFAYDDMKELFEANLPTDEKLYNDFHAQIVSIGKDFCRPKAKCDSCPLKKWEKIRL